jgi:hypothetical protein
MSVLACTSSSRAPLLEGHASAKDKLTKVFWGAVAPFDSLIGLLLTQPLADALALKTYTHGTNFTNYLNIRCYGADPLQGGKSNGSTAKHAPLHLEGCRGYFHLFRDVSEIDVNHINYEIKDRNVHFEHGEIGPFFFDTDNNKEHSCSNGILINDGIEEKISEYSYVLKKNGSQIITDTSDSSCVIEGTYTDAWEIFKLRSIFPMNHALAAGIANWTDPQGKGIGSRIVGGYSGLLTPTISIRVADGDPLQSQLEKDPDYREFAYKTKHPIPTSYIGLMGIITQGITGNLRQRMKAAPFKVTLGIVRLAALTSATWAIYSKFTF